jgi:hypothetical protein
MVWDGALSTGRMASESPRLGHQGGIEDHRGRSGFAFEAPQIALILVAFAEHGDLRSCGGGRLQARELAAKASLPAYSFERMQ